MKQILPICLIALMGLGAFAVPAKKGVRTFTQADGTTISLNLIGDENFHSFVTTDGLAVEKGEDGNFYYRTSAGKSNVIAHNVGARGSVESKFVNENQEEITVAKVAKAAKASGVIRKAPSRVAKRASQVPTAGSPRIPILLVQYKNYSFKDSNPKTTFEQFFNTGSVSALQYFSDQSNGKYTPQFDIYGPITLSNNRSYYGGNDSSGNDKYVGTMVAEACNLINGSLNFSEYDNDGDGECDVVIVMYAGDGEASSYASDAEDAVWPCQWALSESDYGKSLALDQTKVDKFAVFNELNGSNLNKVDGIGTFCHEYSHCLDLPDFYDTEYGNHFGMGPWSLMDYGSYNNDGYTPIGYSAYEKAFMGWINLEEGTENTYYTLPLFNQKSLSTDKAIKVTNDKDKDEYYILENRAQQGWDAYMPYEGMMITHVTYSETAWYNNVVNNYSLQRMTLMPADGELKLDKKTSYGETYYTFNEKSLAGDLWPYGSVNELTDTSTPAAKVNTGSYMGKPITEITKNTDGTVSFWFMKAALPVVATPVNVSHEIESSTSATISWQAGDNADVTYTVEISKHKDVAYELVNSVDFAADNTWTTGGSVNTSNGETYIGSSKKTGSVTSPSFTTDESGVVTVVLSAKSYNKDNSSVKVSLLDSKGMASVSKTVALTTNYATYAIVLNGAAESATQVKIETVSNGKRVYISTADVYVGDASDVANAARARVAAADTKTYTGLTETSILVTDLESDCTYDYRVKAVPVDADSYTESAWTQKYQLVLSATNGISNITVDDADAVYYNLQGIRINGTPTTPGLYICRQGNKSTKVLVK